MNPPMTTTGIIAIVVAALLVPTRAHADPDIGLRAESFTTSVDESGLAAIAVLQALRRIESGDGRGDARVDLAASLPLKDAFDETRDLSERHWRDYEDARSWWDDRIRAGKKSEPPGWDDAQELANEGRARLDKYKRLVNRYWKRITRRYGQPQAPSATGGRMATAPRAGQGRLRAVISAGGGSATYKQEHATPKVDQSTTKLDIRADGSYGLTDHTKLIARLSRESKVEQRAFDLTRADAGVEHTIGATTLNAGFGLDSFTESDDEDVGGSPLSGDYNERRIIAGARGSVFQAGVRHTSRSYDDFPTRDYSVLAAEGAVELGARNRGGAGARLTMRLRSRKNDETNRTADFRELNPRILLNLGKGGPELSAEMQSYTFTEVDDAPGDNTRYKGHLHFVGEAGSFRHGPEVLLYRFPNVPGGSPDPGYADFAYMVRSKGRGKRTEARAFYRLHENDAVFDFVQGTFRLSSFSSARQLAVNLSGRFYTEGKDSVEVQDYGQSTLHPPHEIDAYVRFLWTKLGTGTLRRLGLGPILGHTMYLDTQNDEIVEDVQVVDPPDLVFANPRNLAKAGLQSVLELVPAPGWSIKASARYEYAVNYNGKPTTTTTIYDLRGDATWQFHLQAAAVARVDLHTASIADAKSPSEIERTEISLVIRYLVDAVL